MKDDERCLMAFVAERHGGAYKGDQKDVPFIDALAAEIGMHPKRAEYLAQKWTNRDWWEYGVTLRSGWFTPEGFEHARGLR